jgi:NTE family protein
MGRVINELVCSGGGIKGLAYLGVFQALREYDICIKTIRCVSVGSIFGLLYAVGYTVEELREEMMALDISKMIKLKVGKMLTKYGADSGKRITGWLETMLEKKGYAKSITFKELHAKGNIHYQVFVTNLTQNTLDYFDHETSPGLSVVRAIRMAISIPLVFSVKRYRNNVYVDAAILDNFPIHVCKDKEHVLGIHLRSAEGSRGDIDGLDTYILGVIQCMMVNMDNNPKYEEYKEQTVSVFAGGVRDTLHFEISEGDKLRIVNAGYMSTSEYFKVHNFQKKNKLINQVDE